MRAKKYIKKILPKMPINQELSKFAFKEYMRMIADSDDGAENLIFEVGLSEIAHLYFKEEKDGENDNS